MHHSRAGKQSSDINNDVKEKQILDVAGFRTKDDMTLAIGHSAYSMVERSPKQISVTPMSQRASKCLRI